MLPVKLETVVKCIQCDSCGNLDSEKWSWHFCSLKCLYEWQKTNDGMLPCAACHQTGWDFGFQENGVCTTCGGVKYITEVQK
jgi:hypothetical protein